MLLPLSTAMNEYKDIIFYIRLKLFKSYYICDPFSFSKSKPVGKNLMTIDVASYTNRTYFAKHTVKTANGIKQQ